MTGKSMHNLPPPNTTPLTRHPGKIILKRKSIKVDDIQIEYPDSKRHQETDKLASSIKNLGLLQPILVNPADLTLISGKRRIIACKKVGLRTVRVSFPEDVAEACEEMGNHVTSPDPRYATVMSAREKLDLAMRLGKLPRSSEMIATNSYTDKVTGPAVDLSSRILWRLRSTLLKAEGANRNPPNPGSIEAQHALKLMLKAIDHPIPGYSPSQIIATLHESLKSGKVPKSLKNLELPTRKVRPSKETAQIPPQSDTTHPPKETPWRTPTVEFRRGVDMISGALSGLESLMLIKPPTGDEAEHARNVLKKAQRSIRQIVKTI